VFIMDISGVSTGVVASAATNNGDNATVAVVKKTLDTESQTDTQTADAVSQPTKATEGNLGTRFDGTA
jgi:ferritin-like metal-binding protein YciE